MDLTEDIADIGMCLFAMADKLGIDLLAAMEEIVLDARSSETAQADGRLKV